MNNPKSAVDAITACGETVGSVTMTELTLGKAAVLEKAGSRFAGGLAPGERLTAEDVLLIVFVLAHTAQFSNALLRDGRFEDAVLEFADGIPLGASRELMDAISRILKRVSDVLPQGVSGGGDEANPPEAGTGVSPSSPGTP